MNAERSAMNAIDRGRERRLELSPMMQQAHEKAEREVLHNPDYVIQERSFDKVYDPQTIASDIALADRLSRQFDERMTSSERVTKKIADTFEAIMLMQTEMGNWLGESATTLKTSRFDDYTNKVDMLAEWAAPGEGTRIMALAVDVTFGVRSIEKKLTDIRHEIEAGKLGSVRYFRDEKGTLMGTRFNVARTVVGISQPVIEELSRLWVEGKNKALGEHPIQRVILAEMAFQLSQMEKYAAKLGKHDIAESYRDALAGLRKVLEEKRNIDIGSLTDDPVRREIIEQTKKQFAV